MNAGILDPKDEAIARRVAELVVAYHRPVLTRAEAIAYTGHGSNSAFDRWRLRWGVPPCTGGRYSRGQIERALERESQARRKWTMKRLARKAVPPPAASAGVAP